MSLAAVLRRAMTAQTDARPLAVVRILIGSVAIFSALEPWMTMLRLQQPNMLRTPFVSWLPLLPVGSVPVLFYIWIIAACAFTLGMCTRFAGGIVTLCIAATIVSDQQLYSNQLYLLGINMLLLSIADSSAWLALDTRHSGRRVQVAAWPVFLLKAQVSIVYGYAAIAKINGPYLSGAELLGALDPTFIAWLPSAWVTLTLMAFAVMSVATELFVAIALWAKRWYWLALAAGIVLHVLMVVLVGPVTLGYRIGLTLFAVETVAPYLLFIDMPLRVRISVAAPTT